MIRSILSEEESYPLEIYRKLRKRIEKLNEGRGIWNSPTYLSVKRKRKPYQIPSYDSVRKMLYVLRRLGLIKFTREEPADQMFKQAKPRRYLKLNPTKADSEEWLNPYAAAFRRKDFERIRREWVKPSSKEWVQEIFKKRWNK